MDEAFLLAVDDSVDDLMMLELVLKRVAPTLPFRTITSGREALAYLSGENAFSDRASHPFPTLMLLDLKMPDLNGFDVLYRMRTLPRRPYVAVMSSNILEHDRDKSLASGADSYHTKPVQFEELCVEMEKLIARVAQLSLPPR